MSTKQKVTLVGITTMDVVRAIRFDDMPASNNMEQIRAIVDAASRKIGVGCLGGRVVLWNLDNGKTLRISLE